MNCADCGLDYETYGGVDLVLPDQQWRALVADSGVFLCPNCICVRARKAGGTALTCWIANLEYEKAKLVAREPSALRAWPTLLTEEGLVSAMEAEIEDCMHGEAKCMEAHCAARRCYRTLVKLGALR